MAKIIKTQPLIIFDQTSEKDEILYSKPFYKTVYFLGTEVTIFGLLETKVPHPDTKPIFESFIKIFERELFKGNPEDLFEETLKVLNSEIEKILYVSEEREIPKLWFSTLGMIFGVIVQKTLMISSVGNVYAYLARGDEMEQIASIDSTQEKPNFSVVSTGELVNDDVIILLSSDIFTKINIERLKIGVSSKNKQQLLELFSIEENNDISKPTKSAVCFECIAKDAPVTVLREKNVFSENSSADSFGKIEKSVASNTGIFHSLKDSFIKLASYIKKLEFPQKTKTAMLYLLRVSKIYTTKLLDVILANKGSNLRPLKGLSDFSDNSRKIDGSLSYWKEGNIPSKIKYIISLKWLSNFGKIFLGSFLVVLVLVSFTFCNLVKNKKKDEKNNLQNQLKEQIESYFTNVDTFILTNQKDKAKNEISKIKLSIENLEDQGKKSFYLELLNEKERKIDGIIETDQFLVADFKTVEDTPSAFEFVGEDEIYAFGEKGFYNFRTSQIPAPINKLDIDTKDVGKVLLSSKVEEDFLIFLYSEKGEVWVFNYKDKTLKKSNLPANFNWPKSSDLETYRRGSQNLIYLLSTPNNQIFRYGETQSGFDKPENYFSSNVNLEGATSIAIDGGIFVAYKNGKIEYYLTGEKIETNDFSSNFSSIEKIFRTPQSKDFYLFDSAKKLISVALVDNGRLTFKKSFDISNKLGNETLVDFYPYETGGKIFFLVKDKVYFLNLI